MKYPLESQQMHTLQVCFTFYSSMWSGEKSYLQLYPWWIFVNNYCKISKDIFTNGWIFQKRHKDFCQAIIQVIHNSFDCCERRQEISRSTCFWFRETLLAVVQHKWNNLSVLCRKYQSSTENMSIQKNLDYPINGQPHPNGGYLCYVVCELLHRRGCILCAPKG